MAKKLRFREFKSWIDNREITQATLHDYVEEDQNSPVLKLRFKIDAFIDQVPSEYDVDVEIYTMLRAIEKDRNIEKFGVSKKPDIVAEGDSWFRHGCVRWLYPCAIANVISKNENYNTNNIAYWGDTLSSIWSKKEYMKEIDPDDTEFFMLGGGGNDLQKGIDRFIHNYSEERPLDEYLTQEGKDALALMGDQYRGILSEVSSAFPKVKILCHGYDYPRPRNGSKYIGKYLQEKKIPEKKMNAVINPVIDQLNTVIKTEVKEVPQATFINLLNVTDDYTWHDDMHPDTDGFMALAEKFETKMMPG